MSQPRARAARPDDSRRRALTRLGLSAALAAGLVVGVLALPGQSAGRTTDLRDDEEARRASLGLPHVDPPGTPPHTHNDPATKNEVTRAADAVDPAAVDPTTDEERAGSETYVEQERSRPDPRLRQVRAYPRRTAVPATRYAMASGCYSMTATTPAGRRVLQVRRDGTVVLGRGKASPVYFKATRLGGYLLVVGRDPAQPDVLAGAGAGDAVGTDAAPSPSADWTAQRRGSGARAFFTFALDQAGSGQPGSLALGSGHRLVTGAKAARFALHTVRGCTAYPEAQVDVKGQPFAGVTPYQEVRGYVDAHTHGMAFEFLGGDAHCGRPWHEYGVPYAMVDCPDHTATGGYGALLEAFLSGEPSHDPVGWPTFKDWPAPESLTHEGTYYKWLERSWRGGQRMLVNLLVENNKLCEVYPLKRNSCDDMDSIRLQAHDMYELQDYIDAQFGGPGRGFYRIVKTPFQARKVINSGKMAVVMGIETSVPFGCTFKTVAGIEQPACTTDDIDRQLDEVHRLGVRQMLLVNKFDNALAGVAGDEGTTGVVVNGANFLETGSFWDMKHCEPADGLSHDRNQLTAPIVPEQQDALFGAVGDLFGGVLPAVPLYPPPDHCNTRGLTGLGSHVIRGLAKRQMIFDPDHLSVKARVSALDEIDRIGYHGVISSHSWSTPDAYPRIYGDGGFITPYAGDSTGFVDKWREHVGWADPHYYWGIGYGADINGLGAQGDPRGADVDDPVTYPFTGLGGVTIEQQHAGERVYDLNVDGVAQYGLYPDWVQDLSLVADEHPSGFGGDGEAILDDMARGTEAYLQMWERAVGVAPDSCRNPSLRRPVSRVLDAVRPGMATTAVMRAVGQPFKRLGDTYGVCARTGSDPRVMVTIRFDRSGRVVAVRPE